MTAWHWESWPRQAGRRARQARSRCRESMLVVGRRAGAKYGQGAADSGDWRCTIPYCREAGPLQDRGRSAGAQVCTAALQDPLLEETSKIEESYVRRDVRQAGKRP